MGNNTPLVSVVVITYNSGKTVIDTLDSIKNQTYLKIQLIISDDCSTDDTIQKCTDWVNAHNERFTDVKIRISDTNTGIPGNCNRGVKSASAEWLKLIAGDDLLLPNCIEDFINFVKSNPSCLIVFSRFSSFVTKEGHIVKKKTLPDDQVFDNLKKCKDSREQLFLYLEKTPNITPSLFYRKSLVEKVGCFNERYRLFEDTPFIVEVLKSGTRLFCLEKETVLYRMDTVSVTRDITSNTFYKQNFMDCYLLFRKEKIYSLYKWYNLKFWLDEISFRIQYRSTILLLKNRRTKRNQRIYYLLKIANPYNVIKKILE